jgi:predicted transcriptional regulator of viral defense system
VLAEGQFGLVTRAQLAELCLSESAIGRLVSRGVLRRVRPGVYRLLGAGPSREQDIVAAQLWAGHEAFASHRTGAEIHELPGGGPPLIEITTRARFAPAMSSSIAEPPGRPATSRSSTAFG